MPLTVPLHPVLQVGVNPPGIKTSFSLPLQQDHSTALVIPHCRDSRALEVHTHSVLSSRITCLPTVCILALMGKKKKKKVHRALLEGHACTSFHPSGSWGNGWWKHMVHKGPVLPLSTALVHHGQAARWDTALNSYPLLC